MQWFDTLQNLLLIPYYASQIHTFVDEIHN